MASKSSQSQAEHTTFRRWFEAGFGSETLPIIPPGAELTSGTTVRPEHRGKTPGVRTQAGTWNGFRGKWSDDFSASVSLAKQWTTWAASVGLQTRKFIAVDIDIDDAALATAIEDAVRDCLGFAPVRERPGSARRLMLYRKAADRPPIRKMRLPFLHNGQKQAVEILGAGNQCVVEGPHPKGGAYQWREWHPCETGPDGLTEVDATHLERLFAC